MNRLFLVVVASFGLLAAKVAAQATYTVTPSPTTISASGGQITFNVAMSYPAGAVPSIAAKPPSATWEYVSGAGTDLPSVTPKVGETTDPNNAESAFGFTYSAPPSTSATFSFVLSYPAGLTTNQVITISAGYRLSGAAYTPVTVAAITLPIGELIVITSQPQSLDVNVGQVATFNVTATGTPTLAYQWKKGGTNITGATTASYTIASTVLGDAGIYTVLVSNGVGNVTSNAATLAVGGDPAITTQPQPQAVILGASATFSVGASGTPTLSYQWRKDGGNITGATNTTYEITSVAAGDVGAYTVYVSNGVGNVTSNAAALTIGPPYSVTTNSTMYSTAGGQITFNVTLNYPPGAVPSIGAMPPSATWAYVSGAGTDMPSVTPKAGDTTDPTDSATAFGFTYSAPPTNRAVFSFILSYPAGLTGSQVIAFTANYRLNGTLTPVTVASITLTPGLLPNITSATSAAATVGTAFSYQITADNSPTSFAATGLPAGLTVDLATGVISGTPTTAGSYPVTLTATNTGGASPNATLTITVSTSLVPILTTQPIAQVVLAGGSATYSVAATNPGAGSLTYRWYFTPVGSSAPQSLSDQVGKLAGTLTTSLSVSNVQTSDTGDYVCVVSNTSGDATSTAAPLSIAVRIVRVVSQSALRGANAIVPVQLMASGSENAVGFTLNFNPAQLTYVSAALGAQAADAMLNTNATQIAAGKLGLALAKPAGVRWAAGTQEIVTLTFTVNASLAGGTVAALTFGDSPVLREISDATAQALPGGYQGGAITVASGFEADMNGNGVVSITDWVKVGRIVAGLDVVANGIDFQKADCAGRSTLGNGVLSISDWVQAGRYAAGLDPLTPCGGQTAPNP